MVSLKLFMRLLDCITHCTESGRYLADMPKATAQGGPSSLLGLSREEGNIRFRVQGYIGVDELESKLLKVGL